jgi:anti-sigma B factor antagonist
MTADRPAEVSEREYLLRAIELSKRSVPGVEICLSAQSSRSTASHRATANFDLASAQNLGDALKSQFTNGTTILDLSTVEFCDSSGLRTLVEAHRFCSRTVGAAVAAPTPPVEHMFELTGARRALAVSPNVASALAA